VSSRRRPRKTPPDRVLVPARELRAPWWHIALIVLAGAIAYSNNLSSPFIFDDQPSIADNVELHQWPHLSRVLASAPPESPLAGRPLVSVTFAINYALGGLDVTGYRVVNVAIHLACALLIYGLVRRTAMSRGSSWLRGEAGGVAMASALIWVVHPLNSEVVNYLIQRTESLMAFFALTTLYGSMRAIDSPHRRRWQVLAVVACALGMACKETMVTVPVLVMLYDRVFVFGSVRDAVRARGGLYAALAASWLVLAGLMWSNPRTPGTGFASTLTSPWQYLMNQSLIITRYLWLTLWPHALVLNYGWLMSTSVGDVMLSLIFVTLVVIAAGVTLVRSPRSGFLAAWFVITLAPASSFVPVASEVGAERRMYLPLAALVVLAVVGVSYFLRGRARSDQRTVGVGRGSIVGAAILSVIVIALGARTIARASDYRSALTMAETVVERWPSGAAEHMLGTELVKAGRRDEGIAHLQRAAVTYPPAGFELGLQLFAAGRYEDAIAALRTFVEKEPRLTYTRQARLLIGQALAAEQRWPDAIRQFEGILAQSPGDADALGQLADAYFAEQDFPNAAAIYLAYLDRKPGDPAALGNFAIALMQTGHLDAGIETFRNAARAKPQDVQARLNLTRALLDRGTTTDTDEALALLKDVVIARANDPITHELFGHALELKGQRAEAHSEYLRALAIDPNYAPAREGAARTAK